MVCLDESPLASGSAAEVARNVYKQSNFSERNSTMDLGNTWVADGRRRGADPVVLIGSFLGLRLACVCEREI